MNDWIWLAPINTYQIHLGHILNFGELSPKVCSPNENLRFFRIALCNSSLKFPFRRKWQSLQYSCLENFMNRRDWRATIYWIAKCEIQLKRLNTYWKYTGVLNITFNTFLGMFIWTSKQSDHQVSNDHNEKINLTTWRKINHKNMHTNAT